MMLQEKADELRLETFKAINSAGGGHFGGSLSVIEILTVLLYGIMNYSPTNMNDPNRDRLVLSKGHAGPALYVMLADLGFFEKERLRELDCDGGRLPKHIDRLKVPGVEFSTGPLGQGFSAAGGMALALKHLGSCANVYAVLGDGECDEGQVWEAAMAASHYSLENLIAVVDVNHCQVDGMTNDVMDLGDLQLKWKSFGWNVCSCDGHDTEKLSSAISGFLKNKNGKPSVVIAETIKGRGVSFMEGNYKWHSGKLNESQYEEGLSDLQKGKKND